LKPIGFEKFGIFNIIDSIANSDVSRYNEAMKQNAGQVLLNMMIKAEKVKYEKMVFDLQKQKRK